MFIPFWHSLLLSSWTDTLSSTVLEQEVLEVPWYIWRKTPRRVGQDGILDILCFMAMNSEGHS